MKLLVIGGTVFVGRHLVEAARARGHEVTLLNRGKSRPGVFDDVETVHGDREDAATWEGFAGRTFDAVIDTCGYVPRVVRQSVEALHGITHRYVFISTISVYQDFLETNQAEDAPLGSLDENTEAVTGKTYGPLKVQCEEVIHSAYGDRALIIRPGFIVGPYDPTDRFTYWPHRAAQGGDMLAPGEPETLIQFIDARDLAVWTIHLIEQETSGVFNATGPSYPLTWGTLLAACRTVCNPATHLVWVPDAVLEQHNVLGAQLPLYVSASSDHPGLMTINCSKAMEHGLMYRSLSETIADTLRWDLERDQSKAFQNTLTREKEAVILAEHQTVSRG